ncbi:chemotaxis protein [cyanobacterium TDX16]|nr:chemotaxis protein [cyanobacterium TDX16]
MRITRQLQATGIGLLIFAASNVAFVYLNTATSDSRIVNYAGIVRGGTQRLVKLELAGKKNDKLSAKLDKIINGLRRGDRTLDLPATTEPEFIAKMQEIEKAWTTLKVTIAQVRQNSQYRTELLSQSEDYFELADKTVSTAEVIAQAKVERLRMLQLVLFGMNLLILGIILWINRNIALSLQKSVGTIANTSTQIAVAISEQEQITVQQAVSVNQVSSTMDELGASSQQSAEQVEASATGARQALSLAEGGTKAVSNILEQMKLLEESVGAIATQILNLRGQTNQIGGISTLVSGIASQTNMLALNAAVEAARAGEHGKGFAVVAEEIRKLADQSKQSAEQINTLVADIQAAINATAIATERGTKTVGAGMEMTQGTAASFQGVANSIDSIFLNHQQISLNAQQQALATQQVMDTMNQLALAAQESASGISQIKVGTQQLEMAAKNLLAMV